MTDKRLKTLGLNIKMARLKKEISQEKLAGMIGVSRMTISLIETGNQHPKGLRLIDIAKALDIDINELTQSV